MAAKKIKSVKTKKAPKQMRLDRWLERSGCDLENESYMRMGPAGKDSWEDEAIIGLTVGESEPERLVYSYELLVASLAREFAKSKENKGRPIEDLEAEAAEYIDLNDVRALAYMQGEELKPPLIIRPVYRS